MILTSIDDDNINPFHCDLGQTEIYIKLKKKRLYQKKQKTDWISLF